MWGKGGNEESPIFHFLPLTALFAIVGFNLRKDSLEHYHHQQTQPNILLSCKPCKSSNAILEGSLWEVPVALSSRRMREDSQPLVTGWEIKLEQEARWMITFWMRILSFTWWLLAGILSFNSSLKPLIQLLVNILEPKDCQQQVLDEAKVPEVEKFIG
jgi:hypothetical protein